MPTAHKPLYYISAKPITTPGIHPESDEAEIVGWEHEVRETQSSIEVQHLRRRGIKLYADRTLARAICNTENRNNNIEVKA